MNRLKKILESRFAGIFCFLFAITNRIIFATLYSRIGTDTKLQLAYAENLQAGKGMGVIKYFTNDLSTPVFDSHLQFPPGFSLVIIPFLKFFDGNEYKAMLAYDIVVSILFVIAVRLLGKKAGLSPVLNNIATLTAGCSQYTFFMSWSATEGIALCFILFALTQTIAVIDKRGNIGLLRATATGLLFCLPFFFRYMYLPLAFLFPFFILLSGILLKNKNLKLGGLKTLAASAMFFILLFIFSLSAAENALHLTNVGRGIFFDQFVEWYPFLPASFINIDFGAQLIQGLLGLEYSRVIFYLKIINLVIFVILFLLLWRYLNVQKKKLQFSNNFLFIVIGSFVALAIILLLAWVTLTYKQISWGFHRWTHVQEPRYFAFIYVFMPLLLLICLQYYRSSFKKPLIRFVIWGLFFCLGTEIIHGIYYNAKILISHKDLSYIRETEKSFRSFPTIISEIKNQNPDRELLICAPNQYYLYTASQMGYKAIFDYTNFLEADHLKVSSKSLLLMPIQPEDTIIIKDYLGKKKPRLILTIPSTLFYVQEIDPQ
ncbi:MAG TPA: hypothetical protein VFU29_10655 [Chitinophagaceae bacterium]|nr:hypothetical protein [Chitinophagaceae bacterium]